jgi:hypothetical protein
MPSPKGAGAISQAGSSTYTTGRTYCFSSLRCNKKRAPLHRASLRPGKAPQKTRKRCPFCPQANEHRPLCVLLCSNFAGLRENAKSSVLIYYSIVNLVNHTRAALLCTQDSGGTSLLIFVFEYTIFFSTQHTDWPCIIVKLPKTRSYCQEFFCESRKCWSSCKPDGSPV